MRNVITYEIVRQGLTNPLIRTEAAKVAGNCILTDIFKEKLTQIEEVNQVKPKPMSLHSRSEYINEVGDDFNIEEEGVTRSAKGRIRKKVKTRQTTGTPTQ
jgi:hypothetical protein